MMNFEGGLINEKFVASLVSDRLNKMKQRAPENNEAADHLRRGMNNLANGDLDRALDDFNAAIKIEHDFAPAYVARGVVYLSKGDLDRALADCNAAIKIERDFAQPYFARAAVHFRQGRSDLSMADFSKAIELQPDLARAYSCRSVLHNQNGDLDRALADVDVTIKLEPDYPEAYFFRAFFAYQKKGDLDSILADLDRAIELQSDHQTAYFFRAMVCREKGDLDQAFEDINKAVDLNLYDADAFRLRGLIHKDRGEIEDYEEDFRVAVLFDGELVNDEKYGAEFARIKKADEEEEAPWNDLRAALIQAQSNAEPEQREGWATLLNGALKAVDRLAARRKDILCLNRAAKYLGMEECRDVRTALGYALNEALERLGDLAVFRRDMRRHILALESSGEEKSGFAVALLRVSRSLEALKIEEINDVLLKIRAENSIHALRYLQTRIKTGGRKFTWEEANER